MIQTRVAFTQKPRRAHGLPHLRAWSLETSTVFDFKRRSCIISYILLWLCKMFHWHDHASGSPCLFRPKAAGLESCNNEFQVIKGDHGVITWLWILVTGSCFFGLRGLLRNQAPHTDSSIPSYYTNTFSSKILIPTTILSLPVVKVQRSLLDLITNSRRL